MLKWLLKSLLILAVFVPFATALPVAALWLCRTPDGAQFLFWTGPWSCCFWVLLYTSIIATGWMFGALFASYLAEFLFIFIARSDARPWLPAATFSPLGLAWCWRRVHG